ncbi:MAG: hypothetical protein A3J75_06345 [Acidobacteria bacterium RBG_16_68_9]|nr:MAG: hypothetical protein A3J75_06345 [Acidobacteria bacterium RBG_16_68_9]
MRIEVVATELSDVDTESGQHYVLAKGDIVTVPDGYGQKLCDAGWAKDTTGAYASAPFTPGAAKLVVPKTILGATAKGG